MIKSHIDGCHAVSGGRCRCRDVLALGLAPKIQIPFVGQLLTHNDRLELESIVRDYVASRANDMLPAPRARVVYDETPQGLRLRVVVWMLGGERAPFEYTEF